MTTINDISDFVRILRERPDWHGTVRELILGEELLKLPEQFAEFVRLTTENFRLVHERLERLESDVSELKAGQARLEADVSELKAGHARLEISQAKLEASQSRLETSQARLEGQVGEIKGSLYEARIARNIRSHARRQLNLRQARALHSSADGTSDTFDDLVADAETEGRISSSQGSDLLQADIIFVARQDDVERHFVAEVSTNVDEQDLTRAVRRAGIMSAFTIAPAIPVVIGSQFSTRLLEEAQSRGIPTMTIADS